MTDNSIDQDYYDFGSRSVEDSVHEEFETERRKLAKAFAKIKDKLDSVSGTKTEQGIQDIVADFIEPGTNVLASYDDSNGKLIINASTSRLSEEEVEDIVGNFIQSGTGVSSVNYDDDNDSLIIEVKESNISLKNLGSKNHNNLDNINADDHHTRYTSEEVEDVVSSLLTSGANISLNYDDTNDSLQIGVVNPQPSISDDSTVIMQNVKDINFGTNVSVTNDGDETVTIEASSSADVSDNGSLVVESAKDINAGTNLSVVNDGDGSVTIESTDSRTNVSDNGSSVVEDVVDINAGSNISVTDDGNDTVTLVADSGSIDVSDNGSTVVQGTSDINAGNNLSVSDDGDGSVTINANKVTEEQVDDWVANLLNGNTNVTVTYDDNNNILAINMDNHASDHGASGSDTVDAGNLGGSSGNNGEYLATDGGSSFWTPLSVTGGFTYVQDSSPSSPSEGDTWYDTGVDTAKVYDGSTWLEMTISSHNELSGVGPGDHHTRYSDEEAQDAINALLQAGSNITLSYDDANNTLTVQADSASISDDNTTILSNTTDINFGNNLTATDDGDGTVTVDGVSSSDTHTDISDDTSLVVSDVSDINFGNNISVTDDGDGSVSVNVSVTDTRTDISDDGSEVVQDVTDIDFGSSIDVTNDNDGSVTVNISTGDFDTNAFTFQESVTQVTDNDSVSIQRFTLPSGKSFDVINARVGTFGNNSVSGLEIEVYNHTDGTSIYSTNNNVMQSGTPLASVGDGKDIEVRINNNTGSRQDVQAYLKGNIV